MENFVDSVFIIISNSWSYPHSTIQELSNGTKNTQIEVRMTKLCSYEVGSKTGELLQRRDVENQRCDIAETEHPDVATLPNDVAILPNDVTTLLNDVATLPNDVATFGVGFGWIFSPF